MADNESGGSRVALGELRKTLPLLALLCALLALWIGFKGVQQWREVQLSESLQQARDGALASAQAALQRHAGVLEQKLATPAVRAALASGDNAAAARAVGEGWETVEPVQVLP